MKLCELNEAGLRSFSGWLDELGVSDVTGWRWRKRQWLKVVNISGRTYITQREIERFLARVENGEFSKAPSGVCAPAIESEGRR